MSVTAAPARAQTLDPVYGLAISPAAHNVQALSDRLCHRVQHLGFYVDCPNVWVGTDPQQYARVMGIDALAYADSTGTILSMDSYATAVLPVPTPMVDSVHVLLHEVLHRTIATRGDQMLYWTDQQLWWEEGATEAVTQDLWAGVWRRFWPHLLALSQSAYDQQVAAIRSSSARATGTSWRSLQSRQWRYRFLNNGWDVRGPMLAAVGIQVSLGSG